MAVGRHNASERPVSVSSGARSAKRRHQSVSAVQQATTRPPGDDDVVDSAQPGGPDMLGLQLQRDRSPNSRSELVDSGTIAPMGGVVGLSYGITYVVACIVAMIAIVPMLTMESSSSGNRAPRVGHKKSRKGCAQCKRRHVKCNEEAPCANCTRHGVACSLAGGPMVAREDAARPKPRSPTASSSSVSRRTSHEASSYITVQTSGPSAVTTPGSYGTTSSDSLDHASYHILTSSYDRNLPAASQSSMLDLEIMHYFMTYHTDIMTDQFDQEGIWHVELPRIGFRYPYVNHALLGFSAVHMATQHPARASSLRASAVNHLDQALSLYRQDCVTPVTAENADARFAFTWLVALFMYAIPPSVPPIDAVVEIFTLVKGIEFVLQQTMIWVAQGPLAPMVARAYIETQGDFLDDGLASVAPVSFPSASSNMTPDAVHGNLPEGMDFGLGHLDFMLGMHTMLPEDRRTCSLMLGELKQVYSTVVSSRGTCSVTATLCFPSQDATAFSALLKRRHPQALIILAYYAVLLDIWDARWWISGWGRTVMTDIVGSLGEEWKTWIEWPVQTVLMKPMSQDSISPELAMTGMMI